MKDVPMIEWVEVRHFSGDFDGGKCACTQVIHG